MIQQKVNQWLNSSQDFDSGVKLLEEVDPGSIFLKIFGLSGATKFNQEKLLEILRDSVQGLDQEEEQLQETLGFQKYDFFKLPESLQRDHIRKGELYREAGELRKKMLLAKTDDQRAELADQIMSAMYANQACWERIDHWLQNGEQKPDPDSLLPDLEGMSLLDLTKFKRNNASNLSKWKKKLEKELDLKKKELLQEKITKHTELQKKVCELIAKEQ